jgi:hypothetical protein
VTLDSGGQGAQEAAGEGVEAAARRLLVSLLMGGSGTRAAAAEAARMTGISRRDAYRLALELSAEAAETGES